MPNTIKGDWYHAGTSNKSGALLDVGSGDTLTLRRADSNAILCHAEIDQVEFSSRLGNTPRFITVRDYGKFETAENNAVDQLLSRRGKHQPGSLIHKLESRWHFVFLSLISVSLLTWVFVVYGVPALANNISRTLPQQFFSTASEQTLTALDKLYFTPTELTENKQRQVLEQFQPLIDQHPDTSIDVLFRHGGELGANAMALPDGTVIFTDEMIALSNNDAELVSILGHEVGHVIHRHGIRSMIQSSLFAFLLTTISGDISASADLLLAIPVIFLQLAYSRDFELEADSHAYDYLLANDLDPVHFANIMNRMEASLQCTDTAESKTVAGKKDSKCGDSVTPPSSEDDDDVAETIKGYLSTHPATGERLKRFVNNQD